MYVSLQPRLNFIQEESHNILQHVPEDYHLQAAP